MMKATNPVESLANALYTALASKDILPDVEIEYGRGQKRLDRPTAYTVDIHHFHQVWGSTALGFGGMGGAAMTGAYTTVIISGDSAAIFLGGRWAYSIDGYNEKLNEDIKHCNIASLSNSKKYLKKPTSPTTVKL